MSNEIIIQRLKKAMAIKGITVYALAKRIDIRYELLRRVFAGKRKLSAVELIQILQVLEIDIEDLIKRKEVKTHVKRTKILPRYFRGDS